VSFGSEHVYDTAVLDLVTQSATYEITRTPNVTSFALTLKRKGRHRGIAVRLW
jgi:hypothetical protein